MVCLRMLLECGCDSTITVHYIHRALRPVTNSVSE
jgi:hypothetical protein